MHLHFLLLQKWPQSPWIDSEADDIGKWKEPWLSHIAYRGHFFRFRHPYLHWTGIFDLLWDSPNVPFMGHCLWSQSHFIHDFRLHANVLHIHAFQDQHQQKQSKVQSNLVIRYKLVLRNHFPWPNANLHHKDKEHLVLRNNFRVTKKFPITKFDCTMALP